MPNIRVNVTLELGSQYQIVIKIGDHVLHFEESGSETIALDSRTYVAKIAGFQDPSNPASTVGVEFKKGSTVLNSINISDRKFIKLLFVNVN
ncbi:MAG: hypothetical protein SFU21_06630 [Flavihumibacter sp.]|nr:hypothetical protein [Flavihumibacter sp.]